MAHRKTVHGENNAQSGVAELADELASRIVASLRVAAPPPTVPAPVGAALAPPTHAARIAQLETGLSDAWRHISELQRKLSIVSNEAGVETD